VDTIEPINDKQRADVMSATVVCIEKANELLATDIEQIPVRFDLKGRSAGMYRVVGSQRTIRYNPFIFAKYYAENYTTTIPHEVAHYLTDVIYGYANVKPHGREWRTMMQMFGADASVRCDFDLEGIPLRVYRRVRYICCCQVHELTRVRHNRIQNRGARYFCRVCRTALVLGADD